MVGRRERGIRSGLDDQAHGAGISVRKWHARATRMDALYRLALHRPHQAFGLKASGVGVKAKVDHSL